MYKIKMNMNIICTNNYFYYWVLSLIVLYAFTIAGYAVEFIIIRKKTEFWDRATDEDIIQKVLSIMCNYDKNICLKLTNKQMFIKKVDVLNKTNMEFKIHCYREGVKPRLNEFLIKEKKD